MKVAEKLHNQTGEPASAASRVSLEEQVEGPIKSLRDTLQEGLISEAQRHLGEILQALGLDLNRIPPQCAAALAAVDPNLISVFESRQWSDNQREDLAYACWSLATGWSHSRSCHSNGGSGLSRNPQLARSLQETALFGDFQPDPELENEIDSLREYTFYRLAIADPVYALEIYPELKQRIPSVVWQFGHAVECDHRLYLELRHALPPERQEELARFQLNSGRRFEAGGDTLPSFVLEEHLERKAREYANGQRELQNQANYQDGEWEMNRHYCFPLIYASESEWSEITGIAPLGKCSFRSLNIATAVARYYQRHPDGIQDHGELAHRLLATVEHCTTTELPEELVSFVADLLEREDVRQHYHIKHFAEWSLPDPVQQRDAALELVYSRSLSPRDISEIAKSLPFEHSYAVDWVKEHLSDWGPTKLRVIAAWLRHEHSRLHGLTPQEANQRLTHYVKQKFSAEEQAQLQKRYREDFADGSFEWHSILDFSQETWVLTQHHLPFEEACLQQLQSYRFNAACRELIEHRPASTEQLWQVWTHVTENEHPSAAACLITEGSLMQPILKERLHKAESTLRREVLAPLLAELHELKNDWTRLRSVRQIVSMLEALSRYDHSEAKALLLLCCESEHFSASVRSSFADEQPDEGFIQAIAHIAYAPLRYPEPETKALLERWEQSRELGPRLALRSTTKEWMVLDNLAVEGHPQLDQLREHVRRLLTKYLHSDQSLRLRLKSGFEQAAFETRWGLRKIARLEEAIAEQSPTTHANSDETQLLATLREVYEMIGDWCERQLDGARNSFESGEDLVAALHRKGLRYTVYSDPPTVEEQHRAALPFAAALDREARSRRSWAPRPVPPLDCDALTQSWIRIAAMVAPSEEEVQPESCTANQRHKSEHERSMEQLRDALLQQLDNPQRGFTPAGESEPLLPYAGLPQKDALPVMELSQPLHGESSYIVDRICISFDPHWLAHLPAETRHCFQLRSLMEAAQPSPDWETVKLKIRLSHESVLPLPLGARLEEVQFDGFERANLRWSGHWAPQIDAPGQSGAVTVKYLVPPSDTQAGHQTAEEVKALLPAPLQEAQLPISRYDELPEPLRAKLDMIDVSQRPLAEVVAEVTNLVHLHYRYHFIVNKPEFKAKYRALLEGMPYDSQDNKYLDFIHSLKKDSDVQVLGRGMCGQLSTIALALRHKGIPTFFAAGYRAHGTSVSTNEAHAFVLVPHLTSEDRIFMRVIEATGPAEFEDQNELFIPLPEQEQLNTATEETADQHEMSLDLSLRLPNISHVIEQYQRELAAWSGLGDLSQQELAAVNTVIRAARDLGAFSSISESHVQQVAHTLSALELNPNEVHFADTLIPGEGFLFTPWIQHNAETLAAGLDSIFTDRQRDLLAQLVESGKESFKRTFGE